MIELKSVSKVFQTKDIETRALDDICLKINSSEFVSIMGPSGCGKSTLLNLIGLLDQPTAGTILIHDTDVSGMSDREAARFRNKSLGFVFQNFHLIPSLNVMDNVELPLLYGRVAAVERKERVKEVLNMVGLSHRMKHFPSQLSGGQCQRVAIARAIVGHPEIILADEPTGNLDSRMGEEIMDILLELNKLGVTVVMVTHDEHSTIVGWKTRLEKGNIMKIVLSYIKTALYNIKRNKAYAIFYILGTTLAFVFIAIILHVVKLITTDAEPMLYGDRIVTVSGSQLYNMQGQYIGGIYPMEMEQFFAALKGYEIV